MMVFGGYTGVATGEMWQLNLGATPTWAPVTLGAVAPGARLGHSSVFRASTTTMILFGGGTAPATFAPPTSPGTAAFNDVWQFGM